MGLQTNVKVSSNAFFKGLSAKAERIAGEVARDMADSMKYILYHRQKLKGGSGQWPRWDGYIQKGREGEKHSFDGWSVVVKSSNQFYLTNSVVNAKNGYFYPNILAYGMGPRGNPKWTRETDKVRFYNGRFFSKDLPRGIQPWVDVKREELKQNIKVAIKDIK